MARVYLQNQGIDTTEATDAAGGDGADGYVYGGAIWAWLLVQLLLAAGWTVTCTSTRTSGTGTAANAVTDTNQWTTAAKIAYSESHVGLYHAATGRSLSLQRVTSSGVWRIKTGRDSGQYNIASGATATRVGAVATEGVCAGSGSDASPVGLNFHPEAGSYVFQGVAESTTGAFKVATYPVAGGATGASGCFLALVSLEYGVTGADDMVIVASAGKTPELADLNTEVSSCAWAWSQLGEAGESFERVRFCAVGPIPGSAAADVRTGKKPCAYIRVERDGAPSDLFGRCVDLYWYGPASSVPLTGNLSTSDDLLIMGPLCWAHNAVAPL